MLKNEIAVAKTYRQTNDTSGGHSNVTRPQIINL
jgi:hypothetical protein